MAARASSDVTSREVGTVASSFVDDLDVPSAAEGTLALMIGLGWAAAMPIVRQIVLILPQLMR